MLKIDLHTHSEASPDGNITLDDYKTVLASGILDIIAITDHDTIHFAKVAQAALGDDHIIIGEEISTTDGEIIGLYLTKEIPAGLSAEETVEAIKKQGGLVHIPHPFETVRKGIQIDTLQKIAMYVDSIEAPNGRSLQPKDSKTIAWARQHRIAVVGASDAHRPKALGKTYTVIQESPTINTLSTLLKGASIRYKRPSMGDLLAPKMNRRRKKRKHD